MRTSIRIVVASLLGAVLSTGCATSYMADRGRDAGDIFTLAVGRGTGVKVRAGPLNGSVLVGEGEVFGVRNGALCDPDGPASCDTQSFEFLLAGAEHTSLGEDRGKDFFAINALVFEFPDEDNRPAEFFTQVEAVAGIGYYIRLGVNPGEILDFVLGWTTLDIFNDDLGRENAESDLSGDRTVAR